MNRLILALLFIFSIKVTGQNDYYGENLNTNLYIESSIFGNPTQQPPDIAAFQKVNFIPVSNYTGRVNLNIPIYEIVSGNMSVPISLSYNSSGVKVADMASSVGLNWSLNAGGMISRMIKGIDDFHVSDRFYDPSTPSGWLGYKHPMFTTSGNYVINYYNDSEPDVFIVNAPGLTTKYVHKRHYFLNANGKVYLHSSTNPSPVELESKGSLIEETFGDFTYATSSSILGWGITNIKITSIDGLVYNFSSLDVSNYWNGKSAKRRQESYRLNSVFDPSTSQTITFEYEEYENLFYDVFPTQINSYNGGSGSQSISNNDSYTQYKLTQRLKKIIFDEGEVEFIYELNRLDNEGEKALTDIIVKNISGTPIKHVKQEYSYFQSNIESDTPQSKRLRLDKVYEVDNDLNELPGYTLAYNTLLQMPPRTSYAHDFLGYNNGSYNSSITDPTPKFYFKYSYSYPDAFYNLSPFKSSSAIELTGNYSLEADENYAKTYSLTKITYPTGGSIELNYGLNEFSDSEKRVGGGIRIETEKIDDGKGNVQILDYEYSGGSIGKMPIFAIFKNRDGLIDNNPTSLSQIGGITTFMTPQSQIEFTQGSFVGYNKVTIKNRANNGYTDYFYKSPSDVKNTLSNKEYLSSNSYSKYWRVFGQPSLSVDLDFLRGKITREMIYNNLGELRLEKLYNYTQKDFSTISLFHLNKSSSSSLDDCYYEGRYILNYSGTQCGGYYEELELPISRDLLTTVITKDYQAGKIVYTQGEPTNVPYTFETIRKYYYDTQLPLLLEEEKRVMSYHLNDWDINDNTQEYNQEPTELEDRIFKEYTYPFKSGYDEGQIWIPSETSTLPYTNELIDQNRLSVPLSIVIKNKNREVIAKEEHHYKDFGNVINLEKIKFISKDESITESEIVTKRDSKGRILEYKKKNGIYVSRFYGYPYDGEYLIAEVVNSTYSNFLTRVSNLQTPFDQVTTSDDSDIRQLMSELREAMPEAQVTSYTHKFLIGVSSVTDPRGEAIYYEYDDLNRLKFIKDQDLNILQRNCYNYKGQITDCVLVAPEVPTGLAKTSVTSSSLSFSWTAVSGTVGYKIYKNGVYISSTTGTTASLTGLISSTTYGVQVLAYNDVGDGDLSSSVSMTTSTSVSYTNKGTIVNRTGHTISASTILIRANGNTMVSISMPSLANGASFNFSTGYSSAIYSNGTFVLEMYNSTVGISTANYFNMSVGSSSTNGYFSYQGWGYKATVTSAGAQYTLILSIY